MSFYQEVSNAFIFVPIYAVNRLTFESTAYYYTESRRLANNQRVQLSQAPDAPVFAELQLEGGDGDNAASGEATEHDGVILCSEYKSTQFF